MAPNVCARARRAIENEVHVVATCGVRWNLSGSLGGEAQAISAPGEREWQGATHQCTFPARGQIDQEGKMPMLAYGLLVSSLQASSKSSVLTPYYLWCNM